MFSKRSVLIYPLSQCASGVLANAWHLLGDGVPTVNKTERVLPLLCAVLSRGAGVAPSNRVRVRGKASGERGWTDLGKCWFSNVDGCRLSE